MKMRFLELQDNNKEAKKLRLEKLLEGWKNIEKVLDYQNLLYNWKIVCLKLISRYYNDLFVGHFDIKKIQELIAKKYYYPIL